MLHKAASIDHPMRLELIREGLLVSLANHYTTLGVQERCLMVCLFTNAFRFQFFVWMQKYLIKIIFLWEILTIDNFLIQLEVFIRACRSGYLKKKKKKNNRVILADMSKLRLVMR